MILDSHKNLGIDLDGTLIEGNASRFLADYIYHHPEKVFSIITFRNNQSDSAIIQEIRDYHPKLSMKNFRFIITCPGIITKRYDMAISYKRLGNIIDEKDVTDYLEWKGRICKKIGASVLVDDLEQYVINGCNKYNIAYVDPNKDLI